MRNKEMPMTKAEFIERILPTIERVQESAQGIADWLGECSPEDAASEIADMVPQFAFDD
jgi:hypothetical protein